MTPESRAVVVVLTALIGLPWLAAAIGFWLTGVSG